MFSHGEKDMNSIKKEQLTGYRWSTESEKAAITKSLSKSIKTRTVFGDWMKKIIVVVDGFLIVGLFTVGREYALGEKLVAAVLILILSLVVFGANKERKKDGILRKRIENGEFKVLDCQVYKADFVTDLVGEAIVYICTQQEQYCGDRFAVDLESAKEWKDHRNMPFLLLKIQNGNEDYYELFSEKMLKEGQKCS